MGAFGEAGVSRIVGDFISSAIKDPKVNFYRDPKIKPSEEQIAALKTELEPSATKKELWAELISQLGKSSQRIRAFSPQELEHPRHAGKKQRPTTVGGLLVHVADHTQRHVGQAIVTAKIVVASRSRQLNGNCSCSESEFGIK